jgi:hypothetical protein
MENSVDVSLLKDLVDGNCPVEIYIHLIVCVGVVYSGEYDVFDVTLSVYPHRASS